MIRTIVLLKEIIDKLLMFFKHTKNIENDLENSLSKNPQEIANLHVMKTSVKIF
jgi:hypothetical protein